MSDAAESNLCEVLQKTKKTQDDAYFIYENIEGFRLFEKFFTEAVKTIGLESILSFCQDFQYEHCQMGKFVLRKGDASNGKFYVLLSGKVSVIIPPVEDKAPADSNKDEKPIKKESQTKTGTNNGGSPSFITSIMQQTIQDKDPKASSSNNIAANSQLRRLIRNVTVGNMKEENSSPISGKRAFRRFGTFVKHVPVQNDKLVEENQKNTTVSEPKEEEVPKLTEEVNEEEEEEEEIFNFKDDKDFEEYASKFGVIARYLGKGESFGEMALEKSSIRSANILCRTDCEFLVGTKQQFELISAKKDREKEMFFESAFPFLKTLMLSSNALNYMLGSFKPKTYKKGSYLTIEGKIRGQKPKFFVIYKGECLVEKALTIEVLNPYDKSESFSQSMPPVSITMVGKGMMVGEEVLVTRNEYKYSVKAITETVQVYSITREDFEDLCYREFKDHIVGIYEKRKLQRDLVYEKAKKEQESKTDNLKAENFYNIKNSKMKNITSKAAMQNLGRYMQREQKSVDLADSRLNSFFAYLRAPTLKTDNSQSPEKINTENHIFDFEDLSPTKIVTALKDRPQAAKLNDTLNPMGPSLESKLEFLGRIPNISQKPKLLPDTKDLGSVKFFADGEEQKKQKRIKEAQKTPQEALAATANQFLKQSREKRESVGTLLKHVAKRKRIFKFLSQEIKTSSRNKPPEEKSGVYDEIVSKNEVSSLGMIIQNAKLPNEEKPQIKIKGQFQFFPDKDTKRETITSDQSNLNRTSQSFMIKERGFWSPKKESYSTFNIDMSPSSSETMSPMKVGISRLDETEFLDRSIEKSPLKGPKERRSETLALLQPLGSTTREESPSPLNLESRHASIYNFTLNPPPLTKDTSTSEKEKFPRLHTPNKKLSSNSIKLYNASEEKKKIFQQSPNGSRKKKSQAVGLIIMRSPLISPKPMK